ncbi:MerR family transcriptional regulator [Comamonas badia]|jgi:chaperone modulatory protein CbpM|uniref:MerR family transcriptional regulator n=1 Tax=Comamonas badia TaxID=265291 RepID=UPI000401956A|nr:MerR family transcriptional regulator [Comamonas badia]
MADHSPVPNAVAEILGDAPCLSVQDLAQACRMQVGWVTERLSAGLLQGELQAGHWRCSGAAIVRARRLAQFETAFDADPELAALTTDLIEEVAQLRQQLRRLQARLGSLN